MAQRANPQAIRRLTSHTDGRRALRYMAYSAATDLLTTAVAFGTGLLIARTLGPHDRGVYTLVTTAGLLVAYAMGMGLFESLLARNVSPTHRHQRVALVLGTIGSAALVATSLVSQEPSFAVYALAPILWGLLQLSLARAALAQGWSWIYLRALPNTVQIVITLTLWMTGSLTVHYALAAMLFGYLTALFVDRLIDGTMSRPKTEQGRLEILGHGAHQHVLNIPRMVNYRGPILMLGMVSTPEQVGFFAVASAVGSLVPTLTWSLTQNLLVLTARAEPDAAGAKRVLSTLGHVTSVMAGLSFFFVGDEVLAFLYGDEFRHTWPALVVVIAVQGFWLHSGVLQVQLRTDGLAHWGAAIEIVSITMMVATLLLFSGQGFMAAAYGTVAAVMSTFVLSVVFVGIRKGPHGKRA